MIKLGVKYKCNYFQPKPVPRKFWELDAPKHDSATRLPTIHSIFFRVLDFTHSRTNKSVAAEQVYRSNVAPFFASASIATMRGAQFKQNKAE